MMKRLFYAVSIGCVCSLLSLPARATTPATTSTTLALSASSVPAQTTVTLTAAVTADNKAVTPGLVLFCDASAKYCTDIHILGQAQLTSSGVAEVKLRLGIGSHSIKAEFQGTRSNAKSASPIQNLTVTGREKVASAVYASGGYFAALVSAYGSNPAAGPVRFLDATNQDYDFAQTPLTAASPVRQFAASLLNAGTQPSWVTVADFNGDGIPDLVTTTEYPGTLTVFLGNRDGTFTAKSTFTLPSNSISVAVGDFNGDGIPDLVAYTDAGETPGPATVFLGKGDGTFTTHSTLILGANPISVGVGDFNGDGIPDLAEAEIYDNKVAILLGNGDGTFTRKGSVNGGAGPLLGGR